ncbi:MAG: hypothetical protein C5B51_25110 [Terriglobia bacterium]|nr:MAG: hypothetical protein C5B51_25110 [Terriglobia bacterium]
MVHRLAALTVFPFVILLQCCAECLNEPRISQTEIRVLALTPKGKFLEALQASQFSIHANHAPQTICSLTHRRIPVSVGLILDTSGSMAIETNELRLATIGIDLILSASGPQDEYFLVHANDGASVQHSFTHSLSSIRAGTNVTAKGRTALIDGIYLGLNEMRKAQYPDRALIVLSDGEDNQSLYRLGDAEVAFGATPVPVFLILISPDRRENPGVIPPDRFELVEFAKSTGGASVVISDQKGLVETIKELSEVMRNPYVLHLDASVMPKQIQQLQVEIPAMRPRPVLLYRRL